MNAVLNKSRLAIHVDDLLRGDAAENATRRSTALSLIATTILFGAFYGAVMGAYGVLHPHHAIQIGYGAIKVPMLLTVSFFLSLPSFLVINTIAGVRADLGDVLKALLSMQAGLTVVLASLAPLTAFWYVCAFSYNAALLFNGAMFAVATIAGQWILRRAYRPLITRDPRHRTMLRFWVILYAFVAIQMAWVLRPFIGEPNGAVTFFRHDAWGNAYVEILRIILRSL